MTDFTRKLDRLTVVTVTRTIEDAVDEMLALTEPCRADIDTLAAYS